MHKTLLTTALRFLVCSALLILTGCALLSDHQPPELDISYDEPWPTSEADIAPSVAWLETFEDEALNTIVKKAIVNNYNQQIARTQVNAGEYD